MDALALGSFVGLFLSSALASLITTSLQVPYDRLGASRLLTSSPDMPSGKFSVAI